MDEEFGEFKVFILAPPDRNGESWGRRETVLIRRAAIAASWPSRGGFALVLLASGERWEVETPYGSFRDWLLKKT